MEIRSRAVRLVPVSTFHEPIEEGIEYDPAYLFGRISILVELYIHNNIAKTELEDWNYYYTVRHVNTNKILYKGNGEWAIALSELMLLFHSYFVTRKIGRAGFVSKFYEIRKSVIK